MAKTVLITGTSSGISHAAAKHFAAAGWNVAATMRNPSSEAGTALAALLKVIVLALDVTSSSAVTTAVANTIAHFGGLDALVNNAGYGLVGPMELATKAQIERQFATNLFGPIALMQAVLPHMHERRAGVIVNVTSFGGRYVLPFYSLYHGTKFGLEGVSEDAALELAPLGIRVRLVEEEEEEEDIFIIVLPMHLLTFGATLLASHEDSIGTQKLHFAQSGIVSKNSKTYPWSHRRDLEGENHIASSTTQSIPSLDERRYVHGSLRRP